MKLVNFGSNKVGTNAKVKNCVHYVEYKWYRSRIVNAEYKEGRVTGRHMLKVSFMIYKDDQLVERYIVAPMDTDRLGMCAQMLRQKKEFCTALDLNISSSVWDDPYGPDVDDIIGKEMYIKVQYDKRQIYRDRLEVVHFKSCKDVGTIDYWRNYCGI